MPRSPPPSLSSTRSCEHSQHKARPNCLNAYRHLRDGKVFYSTAVLWNLNAHKGLKRNCNTHCRKLYTVTKDKLILVCCFVTCVCHFPSFLNKKNVEKIKVSLKRTVNKTQKKFLIYGLYCHFTATYSITKIRPFDIGP